MSAIGSGETLGAEDLGLPTSDPLPFDFRPGSRASPLVVSFPHVGLDWPAELGPRPQVNFPRNADYAVDRLYVRAEELGAATVRARYSRLVVDLNRAADDVGTDLVPNHPAPRPRPSLGVIAENGRPEGGRAIRNRGVVWRSAVGNIPLLTTLDYGQFRRRIDRFHAPYYRALEILLARRLRHFGYAILLDAHSMPSSVGGDLVLGTRCGRSCSGEVAAMADAALRGQQGHQSPPSNWPLSLAVDDPYQGGHIIENFGRPDAQIHALQLEVSRAIYMDEYRLEPAPVPEPSRVDAAANKGGGRAPARSRPAQGQRERRRLLALVDAIDGLVLTLSREHEELASRTAAE